MKIGQELGTIKWGEKEYKLERHRLGYIGISPSPSQIDVDNFYKDSYFQGGHGVYQNEYSIKEREFLFHESHLRHFMVEKYSKKTIKNVLDIGCGEGWNMAYFNEKGVEVTGLDISDVGLKTHNPNLLSKVVVGRIEDELKHFANDGVLFDLIYLGNVLEHVRDPEQLMRDCLPLLSVDGFLQVRVPNDFSKLQWSLLKSGKVPNMYWVTLPDHLNYFDLESLTAFSDNFELAIQDVIADFPIDWYVVNSYSDYVNESRGKEAHLSRLLLTDLIKNTNNISDVYDFYSALAKIGQGRCLTALMRAKIK